LQSGFVFGKEEIPPPTVTTSNLEVDAMTQKAKPCLISCSVLKNELKKLVENGELDVKLVFVSKYFHVDFSLVEKNLRQTIEQNQPISPRGIVLVYGDLCLGANDEMKKLTEEYGIVKVDALNCVDCLVGGKGKIAEVDPKHELMVFSPGMVEFLEYVKRKAKQEGIDEGALKGLFNGLRGAVLLDSLGDGEANRAKIDELETGLAILETRDVGLENLKRVVLEALERNRHKTH
jgi:hypothetical protein